MPAGTITVEQELSEAGIDYGPNHEMDKADSAFRDDPFHIRPLLAKPLIQLSNGENKRMQLAIALGGAPDLLIMDNPFLGLDTEGRAILHEAIAKLATGRKQLLLLSTGPELPAAITHIARLERGRLVFAGRKEDDPGGKRTMPRPSMEVIA